MTDETGAARYWVNEGDLEKSKDDLVPRDFPCGQVVLAKDYDALQQRLEEVERLMTKEVKLAIAADGDSLAEAVYKLVSDWEMTRALCKQTYDEKEALQREKAEVERERDTLRDGCGVSTHELELGRQVDALERENAELRRDKESAYKQGVEDAHRCEQRHAQLDQLERENQELKQSHREMLAWFTKMRKAAGGQNDTMGEAVERVAGLERELAAVRACLSGLKITPEQIRQALDDLGPTRDRAEAYVNVATETLIRIMQALAARRGEVS